MSTLLVAHFFNYERSVTQMGKRHRACYLCGEKYEYCPTCSQDKFKPTWMAEFHDENCKTIFDICTRFNMKLLSKIEAQAALKKCDLSNKAKFKDYVQRDLENIFTEEPKAKRNKKVEPVAQKLAVEETAIHEVIEKEDK
jgi:hypothetical protein